MASVGFSSTEKPQISARPEVGGTKPAIMRMVVVLPAPLGPRKPSTSPGWTVKLMLSTAVSGPYCLVSDSALIMLDPLVE